MVALSLALTIALAFIHIIANKLKFLQVIPRSKWLSFAGGVAVSYVFVHILPELQEWQAHLADEGKVPSFFEHHLYLVSLIGLVIFYGLERAITRSRNEKPESSTEDLNDFWWHIGSFALYNMLIGYLMLHQKDMNYQSKIFLFVALAFHFFVNDYGLLNHHRQSYISKGRWIMAASVIIGWLIAFLLKVPVTILSLLFALLAGGIVLNTLKEELPEERESNFWAFLLGTTLYTVLMLLV